MIFNFNKFNESGSYKFLDDVSLILDELSEKIEIDVSLSKTWDLYSGINSQKIHPVFILSFQIPKKNNDDRDDADRFNLRIQNKIEKSKKEAFTLESVYNAIKRIEKISGGEAFFFREDDSYVRQKYLISIRTLDETIITPTLDDFVNFLSKDNPVFMIDNAEFEFNDFNFCTGTLEMYRSVKINHPLKKDDISKLSTINGMWPLFVLELKEIAKISFFVIDIIDGKAILERGLKKIL